MILPQKAFSDTILYLDMDSLLKNLEVFQGLVAKNVKIMAMIKANAYGTGAVTIAKALEKKNIDYFGVAYADEGNELRINGIKTPIMVMNPGEKNIDLMISQNLEPEIFSKDSLHRYMEFIQQKNISDGKIHIKVDTGMNRLGFKIKDLPMVIESLKNNPSVKVLSIMSHFASADISKEDAFTRKQNIDFNLFCEKIESELGYKCTRHISNTSATERHTAFNADMVRIGIGLYGHTPINNTELSLSPVAHLYSKVSHIHFIREGEGVSYGRDYIAKEDRKIATIPIGYADGFPRLLSNGVGKMFINGKLYPVIGKVCMDMTMLDITDSDIKVGDPVEIFGSNIKIIDFAKNCKTTCYEVLTRLSSRIDRIPISNQK